MGAPQVQGGVSGPVEGLDRSADLREEVVRLVEEGRAELDESAARRLFGKVAQFGPAVEVTTRSEALAAADRLGFPVVVKGLDPDRPHKSDHGLVVIGCADADAVAQAFEDVSGRLPPLSDQPWGQKVSVQRQLCGIEVAIGIRQDPLGPLCMVAAGGTLVELLQDVAAEMAPLSSAQVEAMLERLKVGKLLQGYRDHQPVARKALVDLVVRVSELAVEVPEISELDLNPVFVSEDGAFAADAQCSLRPTPAGAASPGAADGGTKAAVRSIFEPRRIAIVGASQDRSKVGGLVSKYLVQHGFPGEVVAVNPKAPELEGIALEAPSIAAAPEPIDLACIAVPDKLVESVVRECVEAGIPAGIIFSAGFAEVGEDGARAQERLVDAAAGRFHFVGPNSIGAASPEEKMFATFGMALEAERIAGGALGFVSQSGAIASSLFSRSQEFGVGFSHWISTGNEADLGVADYVEYLAEDPGTAAIALFLEVVREPDRFAEACALATAAGKPLVAVKTGTSEAGRAAAASHTGALTGSEVAYRAFLERSAVIQVDDLPSLFAASQGLISVGPTRGPRVGIISMSGGACSLLADACARNGLEVPMLPADAQARLTELLPAFGGVRNPVDVTAQGIGSPGLVRLALEMVRDSGVVDLVLVQLSTNADPAANAIAADLVSAQGEGSVPFLVGRLGSPELAPKAIATYAEAGMHVFAWPEQLVQAARACAAFGRLSRTSSEPPRSS